MDFTGIGFVPGDHELNTFCTINKIIKRNCTEPGFYSEKITSAIRKAGEATEEFGIDEVRRLTLSKSEQLAFRR